jgi:hypothetical protein
MLRTQAAAGQQQSYNEAVRHAFQSRAMVSLAMVDNATLVGLTRLGIAEVEALKQGVAEILPAGNLPAFLLQGLVQLKDRTLKPERVAADLRLLFQVTKQIGSFGIFLERWHEPYARLRSLCAARVKNVCTTLIS